MSDSEQDRRETLADIVAEIRRAVEYMGDDLPYTVSAGAMRKIASRIEAAGKRERDSVEANALACGGIVEASRHTPGNAAAMREELEALRQMFDNNVNLYQALYLKYSGNRYWRKTAAEYKKWRDMFHKLKEECDAALSAPPHKGKWKNGTMYEYEYAYCSECGLMQWAGWDTHNQAKENIESFARDYKFCPGCGTEMEGGVYVQ